MRLVWSIESYHAYNKFEWYHSEIKTDMDAEYLSSKKFKTNTLVLDPTILTFNILHIIGYYLVRTYSTPKMKHSVKG